MRAVMIQQFGRPSGMAVVRAAPAVPQSVHLVVEKVRSGSAGSDAVVRRGTLGPAFSEEHDPRSEVAGTVSSVGAGVDPAWVGAACGAFTGDERRLRGAGRRAGRRRRGACPTGCPRSTR